MLFDQNSYLPTKKEKCKFAILDFCNHKETNWALFQIDLFFFTVCNFSSVTSCMLGKWSQNVFRGWKFKNVNEFCRKIFKIPILSNDFSRFHVLKHLIESTLIKEDKPKFASLFCNWNSFRWFGPPDKWQFAIKIL